MRKIALGLAAFLLLTSCLLAYKPNTAKAELYYLNNCDVNYVDWYTFRVFWICDQAAGAKEQTVVVTSASFILF